MAFPKPWFAHMLWFKPEPWFEQSQCFCVKTIFVEKLCYTKTLVHKHHVLHKNHVLAGPVQGLLAACRINLSVVAGGTRRRRLNKRVSRSLTREPTNVANLVKLWAPLEGQLTVKGSPHSALSAEVPITMPIRRMLLRPWRKRRDLSVIWAWLVAPHPLSRITCRIACLASYLRQDCRLWLSFLKPSTRMYCIATGTWHKPLGLEQIWSRWQEMTPQTTVSPSTGLG